MNGKQLGHPLQPLSTSNDASADAPPLFRHMPHNAGANSHDAGSLFSESIVENIFVNQIRSVTGQLESGARALMLDVKKEADGSDLCS